MLRKKKWIIHFILYLTEINWRTKIKKNWKGQYFAFCQRRFKNMTHCVEKRNELLYRNSTTPGKKKKRSLKKKKIITALGKHVLIFRYFFTVKKAWQEATFRDESALLFLASTSAYWSFISSWGPVRQLLFRIFFFCYLLTFYEDFNIRLQLLIAIFS